MGYYDYGYTDYGYTDYEAAFGILGGIAIFGIIIMLVALAVGIIQTIAFWKIFKKAGKGGWEAIIPFYGNWVLMEISGLNWWWFLFLFAPFVLSFVGLSWLGYLANLFAMFNCYFNLAKKFNKSTGFAVCLTLFTPICAPMLGFSKNVTYNGSVPVSKNGCIGAAETPVNNNVNNNYNSNYNYQNNVQPQPVYNNTVNNVIDNNVNVVPENTPVQDNNVNNNVQNQPVQEFSFCGNCGTRMNAGTRFCPNCGKEIL